MIASDSLPRAIFNSVYWRTIRDYTPPRLCLVNGEYAVYGPTLFDERSRDVVNDHETELLDAIDATVSEGDDVVVVGGGIGVSTLACIERVGSRGTVHTIEASEQAADRIRMTLDANNVQSKATVTHAAVGPVRNLWGRRGTENSISPGDLPDCDVLVMDCEGAEETILENLEIRPRAIIVESHGFLDSPSESVIAELDRLGYEIWHRDFEDEEQGVEIITTELEGMGSV